MSLTILKKLRAARAATPKCVNKFRPLKGSKNMPNRMGLIYPLLVAESVSKDVLIALALISGGVANCLDAIADQQKESSVKADLFGAGEEYIAVLLHCLRDDNKRKLLIRTLETAELFQRKGSS